MPKFSKAKESSARSMIWRATGVYEINGRLRIQWPEHGTSRYEFLRPGSTVEQGIGRRERHILDAAEGRKTPTGQRLTYEGLVEGRVTALDTRHKASRAHPGLDAYFRGWKALSIDYAALQDYVRSRQEDGAADSTIHNELAALRRAFRRSLAPRSNHHVQKTSVSSQEARASSVIRAPRLTSGRAVIGLGGKGTTRPDPGMAHRTAVCGASDGRRSQNKIVTASTSPA
jgi:hypothetical protein